MTDDEFLIAFESCSLLEDQWTHQAHVRMAWLYLKRMPLPRAIPVVREGIMRYNGSLKKLLSYHETITRAFLHLIHARMRNGEPDQQFEQFCATNPDLFDRKMTVLLTYYRKETLFSQEARETFVSPDLALLPNPAAELNLPMRVNSMKSELESVASFLDSLNNERQLKFLAQLMYELTLAGRASYSVDSSGLDEPKLLRAVNELQHRVSAQMMNLLSVGGQLRSAVSLAGLFLESTCEQEWHRTVIRNALIDAISSLLHA